MDGKIKTILRLPSPKFIQVLHANNCFFFLKNFYIFYYYIYFLYFILLISGHWLIVFMERTPFLLVFSWSNLKKKVFPHEVLSLLSNNFSMKIKITYCYCMRILWPQFQQNEMRAYAIMNGSKLALYILWLCGLA